MRKIEEFKPEKRSIFELVETWYILFLCWSALMFLSGMYFYHWLVGD